MSFELNGLLPLVVLVVGFLAALLADIAARGRAEGGDTGTYWSRVAFWTAIAIGGPLVLLYAAVTGFPEIRPEIPWIDRQEIWLFLPMAAWAALLAVGLFQPAPAERGRWLAGSVGYGNEQRGWVALCSLPLLAMMAMGWSRLGDGPSSYPAAHWTTAALLSLTLLRVGWSRPAAQAAAETAPAEQPHTQRHLTDWPEAMRRGGIALADLFSRSASTTRQRTLETDRFIAEWRDRLAAKGSFGISESLLEAVYDLTKPKAVAPGVERNRLILAPDNFGQHEAVGLAAADLARKLGEATLIVTPSLRPDLVERIERWAAPPEGSTEAPAKVAAPRSWKDLQEAGDADVWIVDAETLSDQLLPRLRYEANKPNLQQRNLVSRIGMVVWWDVHAYTGALAANIWAISRRLDRIISEHGRSGVRTLALARKPLYADAEMKAFRELVLPKQFDSSRDEVRVNTELNRPLRAYRIEGDRDLLRTQEIDALPAPSRRLALTASFASVKAGWTTRLDTPAEISAQERRGLEEAALDGEGAQAADRMTAERPEAEVSILPITDENALALGDVLATAGRSTEKGLPHFVGILPPQNPYLNYLLQVFDKEGSAWKSSRLLIPAKGNPGIVRRHLLHALHEVEERRDSLAVTLGWDREILLSTLRELALAGQLMRREVLFLDDDRRLQTDWLCRNDQAPDSVPRPLRTVGADLITVRRPEAAQEALFQVDQDRAGIEAYPGRVFIRNGERYRIDEWGSTREVAESRVIHCSPTDRFRLTWRRRFVTISRPKMLSPRRTLMEGAGTVAYRFVADLAYREHLAGWLERTEDGPLRTYDNGRPIQVAFTARSFVVAIEPGPDKEALEALAAALRHVLPVHLGADEDSLEVAPVYGVFVDGAQVFGIAIVDLYPGGIGLAEVIESDPVILQNILVWTHQWLRTALREGAGAAEKLSESPLSRATAGEATLDFQAAEELLSRLVSGGPGR